MNEKIERFRQKVGGNISIFVYSAAFLLYPLILIPGAIWELASGRLKNALILLLFSIVTIGIARGFFLFLHWGWKASDRLFNKIFKKENR